MFVQIVFPFLHTCLNSMLRNLYFDVLQDDQANYNTSFERWLDENVAAEIETSKIEFERQFVMEV